METEKKRTEESIKEINRMRNENQMLINKLNENYKIQEEEREILRYL